jgi:gliding motility-associated-like protein
MKNKLLYSIIFIFFLPLISTANHIVGGSLTYEQQGGSTYRITLTLYRDCTDSSNPSFPSVVKINIAKNNGTFFKSVSIPFSSATNVPPKIDTCVVNPGICLQEAVYSQVVTGLPPSPGGYHVYFQLCCRTSALLNIVDPSSKGDTFYTHIPDNNVVTTNSSPDWTEKPQSFICQGSSISIAHGASDPDGDSLYYSLYTPYDTSKITFPGGVFTVSPLPWELTYGPNNPLNANQPNSLQINSKGLITGSPAMTIGVFVIGIKCEEYRNGVKLGQILRDFQLKVVPCPPKILASYSYTGNCYGLKVNFTTLTSGASTYYWDFGNTATLADTSRLKNPTYTYPGIGIYSVMLIINKGTPCADTSIKIIHVTSLNAEFTSNTPACQKTAANFTDISTIDSIHTVTAWNWDFGNGNTSAVKNPKNTYINSGNYVVTLVITASGGCKDTVSHSVSIQPAPVSNAGNDTSRCANNPAIKLTGTIQNAGGGIWKGSGSFIPNNNVLNPTYTSTTASIQKGKDTLLLISTNNGVCPADTDMVVISFTNAPSVSAGNDLTICRDTASIPLCATVSIATGVQWKSLGSGTFITDSTKLCTSYKPSKADTAAGTVVLYVTTTGNGNCVAVTDSMRITFTSTIKVNITSKDTACVNSIIPVSVTVSTNSGIWSSSGSGLFKPSATSLKGFYIPSKADSVNGWVKLYFTSTNNGICMVQKDTITVFIIPVPSADFSVITDCEGKASAFTDTSLPLGDVIEWDWDFGNTGISSNLQNPRYTYTKGGSYPVTLIATSKNGCKDTVHKKVVVPYNPVANFNTSGICVKEGVQFTDSSLVTADTLVKWNWYFGDSKTDTLQNPLHYFPAPGTYLNLLVVKSWNGCVDSVEENLTIAQGPSASFSSNAVYANVKQVIQFTDLSNQATIWLWNFGDASADSISTLQHPSHTYLSTGHFQVCLFVGDKNNCRDTVCKTEVISLPVGIPNAFSPNGDGQNDLFMVYGGPFIQMNMKIYNHWGDLIFQSDKQSEGWDGRVKGIEQPAGVYIYSIYCVSEDGEEHKLSGDVTLLR